VLEECELRKSRIDPIADINARRSEPGRNSYIPSTHFAVFERELVGSVEHAGP
jgi:hypothetical protein